MTECPGCGNPFESPDHDPGCSSCVESGTGDTDDPLPRPLSRVTCTDCLRLVNEIARLNFELGKLQGEVMVYRERWIAPNYVAWEQGRSAGRHERNPYPKPEE